MRIGRVKDVFFRCEICGCSYNFVSSLTRHMVQKHIKTEGNFRNVLFYNNLYRFIVL